MPSTKILLRYCLALFLGYGLLLWLGWTTPFAKTFAKAFHGITFPLLEKSNSDHTFFSKSPEGDHFYDYKLRYIATAELERQKAEATRQGQAKLDLAGGQVIELKYHQIFFNPWFFLLCLILVTPLPWQRKLLAVGTGSLLFYLFAFFKINFILRQQASGNANSDFLDVLVSPGFVGFVVIAIWAMVAFRKRNWRAMVGSNLGS